MSTWYGTVPTHWKTIRLANILREVNEPGEDGLPYLSVSISHGISSHELSDDELNRKVRRSADNTMNKRIRPGDIVFNMMRAWQGAYGAAMVEGMTSPAYIVARPTSDINSKFLERLLHTPAGCDESKCKSHGITDFRLRLYWEGFKDIHIPLPLRAEQDQIVRYLDWKVSQINRLINAKKKQIGLLQEQKRAVVNAVIPENGDVVRFRHIFNLTKGLNITKANLVEKGVPCVSYGQIHSKYGFEVNPDVHQLPFVPENYLMTNPQSLMHFGDFVFADTSEDIAGSGNFTYLNSHTPAFAGYHTIIARPIWERNYRYIAYYLDSPRFRSQIQQQVNGVKVYSITRSILNSTVIELPSEKEQDSIVKMLDARCANYKRLIDAIGAEITLLHEYRTRLISDVVTGKLDVRGVAVPEFEAVEEKSENEQTEYEDIAEDDDE